MKKETIIPKTAPRWQTQSWQQQLKCMLRSNKELANYLQADLAGLGASDISEQEFEVRIPEFFAERIDTANPDDPILRQVFAHQDELLQTAGFSSDPLHESQFNPVPGLIHKYKSRVLMVVSSACAIHCRYCFRRHFPYEDNNSGLSQQQRTIDYIQQNPAINEVILSGGDPLSIPNKPLFALANSLSKLAQIKRLRIHTRLPVVIPARIDTEFLQCFAKLAAQFIVVLHINHAQEVSPELRDVVTALNQLNCRVYNQAVLLKGVNDCAQTLCDLSEACFQAGIQPYYLHLLDRVQGASHFEVSVQDARKLLCEVRKELPGYLVPQLTIEEPGAPSKTAIV